ncbi:YqaJ viral recombinase family protein [Rugamonas sp.]|uniref:YqaJ viral recombinase family protein n=1 Tax=Rugamonas sp. TaxID=1926287 RepID=UPI0025D66872|nr:YqaJ viral recombinase family protein [Rugamonas sp.]
MHRDSPLTREIHDLLQGSDAWHEFRFNHHGASEAAAMLGLSKKVTRTDLVRMKATGLAKEFSEWVQANILDYGHEVEALARPFAEKIIGDDLYPVTSSLGAESASCDGLNMAETIGFEHKQWNAELAASVAAGVLPDDHQPQVQQQLMVTGAEKWMFMVSDGTEGNMVWMWVYPDTAWFARIIAGWEQFDIEVAKYEQVILPEKAVADPIAALPALVVQTEGKVVSSNLAVYKHAAERFLAAIKTELLDDEDFANAENTVKFCGEAEDKLELAKAAALAQTSTIDDVMRTVDHIKEQFRTKRLQLEKLVKTRKEQIKETILMDGKREYADHVAALEKEIAPLRLVLAQPDFAGAMKNKRTLASLHDAVNTTLGNAKIAAGQQATDYRAKQAWCKESVAGFGHLFADMAAIITKPMDDFQLVVTTRVDAHRAAEAKKETDLRAKLAAEEKAKADAVIAEAARLAQIDAEKVAAAAVEQERARVAAETKRQLEVQQVAIAAQNKLNEQAAASLAEQNRLAVVAADDQRTATQAADNIAADARAAVLRDHGHLTDLANKQLARAPAYQIAPNVERERTPPSLRLGQIGDRLGFTVTADFVLSLGFAPAATDKAAKLYHEVDFPRICSALLRHIDAVRVKYAA